MTQDQFKVLMEIKDLMRLNELTWSKFIAKNDWQMDGLIDKEMSFIRHCSLDEIRKKLDFLGYKPSLD